MDPDANLREQMKIAKKISQTGYDNFAAYQDDAERLAELVISLNNWIVGGGFYPKKWRNED